MESSKDISEGKSFGYVVVINRGEEGYVGGYLCTDDRGAPIEFWHTVDSPVKVTRLQELLYGKALMPELLGKTITGSLLCGDQGKAREEPTLLLTQEESILRGFDIQGIAVVLISPVSTSFTDLNNEFACQEVNTDFGDFAIRWSNKNTAEVEQLIPMLKTVDVIEPFERIRMLLDEIGKA